MHIAWFEESSCNFGWRDPRQAQTYTKAARQKEMARIAMPLLMQ
jgi:hypothetical protein